jgi:Uma2 family endonuclease
MRALVLDSSTAGFDALLERRRRSGLARLDEVWAGVLHMITAPSLAHARIAQQLAELLGPLARTAGLECAMHEFNLGNSEADFRVPDGALHRPGAHGTWLLTAALVVEIVSPGDETWEKLPFYASHNVDEVLIVDPLKRTVTWLGLAGESYSELSHSALVELDAVGLAEQIEWPPAERKPRSPTPVQRS